MADVNNGSGEPRRWAPSRIASAAVLVLLVLGGIAYGIYSLTSNGSNNSNNVNPNSSKSQNLTNPAPQKGTSKSTPPKTATNGGKTSTSGSKSSGTSSSSSSASSSASGGATPSTTANGQLSNTGPGDVAAVGFVVASVVGAFAHYGWRKFRSA